MMYRIDDEQLPVFSPVLDDAAEGQHASERLEAHGEVIGRGEPRELDAQSITGSLR